MMSPTSGATASQRPKMRDVLTDRPRVGLSPPRTIEVRKLSRLRVTPRVRSEIIRFPRTLAARTGDAALQVGSHPFLRRGRGARDPNVEPNRDATARYGDRLPRPLRSLPTPRRDRSRAHTQDPGTAVPAARPSEAIAANHLMY